MKRRQSGFTIVELMLASMILLVALTASMGVIAASLRAISNAKQLDAAANFTRTASNLIRNTSFSNLTSTRIQQQLTPIWQQQAASLGQQTNRTGTTSTSGYTGFGGSTTALLGLNSPTPTFSVNLYTEATDPNGIPILLRVTCTVRKNQKILSSVSVRVSNRGINP